MKGNMIEKSEEEGDIGGKMRIGDYEEVMKKE